MRFLVKLCLFTDDELIVFHIKMDSLPLEHFIDPEVAMNVCLPSAGHYSLFNRSRGELHKRPVLRR
jgi:hypothetical protein